MGGLKGGRACGLAGGRAGLSRRVGGRIDGRADGEWANGRPSKRESGWTESRIQKQMVLKQKAVKGCKVIHRQSLDRWIRSVHESSSS